MMFRSATARATGAVRPAAAGATRVPWRAVVVAAAAGDTTAVRAPAPPRAAARVVGARGFAAAAAPAGGAGKTIPFNLPDIGEGIAGASD